MIIFFELSIIVFLSSWLFDEYLNNPFMQEYLANIAPTVVPILSVTFGGIAAMTATTLYIRVRRSRMEQEELNTRLTQPTTRRTPRKRSNTGRSPTVKSRTELPGGVPSPNFIITESKPAEQKIEPAPAQTSVPAAQPAQPEQQTTVPPPAPAPQSSQAQPSPSPATSSVPPGEVKQAQ